jgi:nucleoside-diphosphate-sugar epimerase
MHEIGWRPRFSLRDGLAPTYEWIAGEVQRARASTREP